MRELYRKNREDLSRLVQEMGTFTKRELVVEFQKDRDSILIDGRAGIDEYLDGLRFAGVLDCQAGVYFAAPSLDEPIVLRQSYL